MFKPLKITSHPDLDGTYTVRIEFGTQTYELPKYTRQQIFDMARELEDAAYMDAMAENYARENDNTGVS